MTTPLKPEPSLTTLGRAKAKGTDQEYVNPTLSVKYAQMKAHYDAPYEIPSAQSADATAAPLPHEIQAGAPVVVRRSPHR